MASIRETVKSICANLGIPAKWVLLSIDEFRMIGIRLYAFFSPQSGKIATLLQQQPVQLIFGCGETRYPGWTGVDCYFGSGADLVMDLRRPLPFPDQSVDLCFSEHFLEHLYPDEGLQHLREVVRVLKPGGVYRIVVPDVVKFFRKYSEGDAEFFKLAFPWAERPMQALYDVANWGGIHRNILDFPELQWMANKAGFAHAVPSAAGQSANSALRIDRMEPQRIAESFYVELFKAGRRQ